MDIETSNVSGVAVLRPKGRMALGGGDVALRETLDAELEKGTRAVLLNLSGLDYVDSAGLGEIASGFQKVKAQGGRFAVCEPNANIRTLLSVSGLERVIENYPSEAEALSALGGG